MRDKRLFSAVIVVAAAFLLILLSTPESEGAGPGTGKRAMTCEPPVDVNVFAIYGDDIVVPVGPDRPVYKTALCTKRVAGDDLRIYRVRTSTAFETRVIMALLNHYAPSNIASAWCSTGEDSGYSLDLAARWKAGMTPTEHEWVHYETWLKRYVSKRSNCTAVTTGVGVL